MDKAERQAISVPVRGDDSFTFHIKELFDNRLGQTIFEVYAKHKDTGRTCLIAECSTRADARDVIKGRREEPNG